MTTTLLLQSIPDVRPTSRTVIRFGIGQCSLGFVLVAVTDKGMCAVFFGDDRKMLVRELRDRFANEEMSEDPVSPQIVAKVIAHIEQPTPGIEFPLDLLGGTLFQRRVWEALRRVSFGQTATYAQIAHSIGAPLSMRAVAQACGANPVAVLIPCHRVIRSDGLLSGYRWGVERKKQLLEREQIPA